MGKRKKYRNTWTGRVLLYPSKAFIYTCLVNRAYFYGAILLNNISFELRETECRQLDAIEELNLNFHWRVVASACVLSESLNNFGTMQLSFKYCKGMGWGMSKEPLQLLLRRGAQRNVINKLQFQTYNNH